MILSYPVDGPLALIVTLIAEALTEPVFCSETFTYLNQEFGVNYLPPKFASCCTHSGHESTTTNGHAIRFDQCV